MARNIRNSIVGNTASVTLSVRQARTRMSEDSCPSNDGKNRFRKLRTPEGLFKFIFFFHFESDASSRSQRTWHPTHAPQMSTGDAWLRTAVNYQKKRIEPSRWTAYRSCRSSEMPKSNSSRCSCKSETPPTSRKRCHRSWALPSTPPASPT